MYYGEENGEGRGQFHSNGDLLPRIEQSHNLFFSSSHNKHYLLRVGKRYFQIFIQGR